MHVDEKRPVLSGLAALVGVAVVVGLVAGLTALAGARVLGLDGAPVADTNAGIEPTAGETLYLPKPSSTQEPSEPLVTLVPSDEESEDDSGEAATGDDSQKDGKKRRKKDEKDAVISLSAGQLQVGPMERIDLTGTYPAGEGAVLQVQRLEGGTWSDFPVTVTVSNQTFSTYVQTGQAGPNKFRVIDSDTGKASNPVTVRVG